MSPWAVAAPSAAELAAHVRAGRADPVELVERALARIAECDGEVGAFVHVDVDGALVQARARAAERDALGPLHGVPVAVKDLYDVAGQVTRAGSRVPSGPPATRDAAAVARLRAAGAVVLGRTRTHEFAWGITTQSAEGSTRNPWDTSRVPGGSSGGSAAAVAAGVVPLALGTDTGCSIRLPAAWCGLVGHKPTYGLVPLDGVVPLAPSLDCGGALVRTAQDARLALEVLSGRPLAAPAPPAGLRIGAVAAAPPSGLPGVREVRLPLADRVLELYGVVQGPEALAVHRAAGWWPDGAGEYGPDVRRQLERCERLTPGQVQAGARLRAELRAAVARLFEQVDLLLLPVATAPPPRTATPDVTDAGLPVRDAVLPWTVTANLCGLPACSVPVGRDALDLPVGLQVVGPPGADARVLDVAARLAG